MNNDDILKRLIKIDDSINSALEQIQDGDMNYTELGEYFYDGLGYDISNLLMDIKERIR